MECPRCAGLMVQIALIDWEGTYIHYPAQKCVLRERSGSSDRDASTAGRGGVFKIAMADALDSSWLFVDGILLSYRWDGLITPVWLCRNGLAPRRGMCLAASIETIRNTDS